MRVLRASFALLSWVIIVTVGFSGKGNMFSADAMLLAMGIVFAGALAGGD